MMPRVSIALIACVLATPSLGQEFKPGHVYVPSRQGDIVEWSPDLIETRRFRVEGTVEESTGAAFNDRGNLVFLGYEAGFVSLFETDASGTVRGSFKTGQRGLGAGSHIAYDRHQDVYVFANSSRVTMLDGELNLIAHSDYGIMDRVSGLAFWEDGRIIATDLDEGRLTVMEPDLSVHMRIDLPGWANSGITRISENEFVYAETLPGGLNIVDVATGEVSPFTPGTHRLMADVDLLPGGDLVSIVEGTELLRFSPFGELLARSEPFPSRQRGSSVAVYIPAPATLPVIVLGTLLVSGRRRGECPRVALS